MPESVNTIFCPLPFAHTDITTDGTYAICCQHIPPKDHAVNINRLSVDQWKNSNYVTQVKDSFIQNQQHPGCKTCWNLEAVGQRSYRQQILKDYTFFRVTTDTSDSVSVQVNLGNLCNLSCLMCDEKYSSAILSENKKLGINIYEQKDFSWTDRSFEHLQQIFEYQPKILTIIGGEPLYIKQFLDLLEKMPEDFFKKTMLHITTNATVWNDRWARVIERFKLARITFSLDATKDLYEYIRFPASWDQVTGNIQQITKLKNVKTTVNCTVQNLNVGKLFDIITWCMQQNLWLTLSQLSRPNYLSLTNLPAQLKNQAIDELDRCLTIPDLPAHIEKFIQSCQTQLVQSLREIFDQVLWTQCVTYLETRDQLRHNSHKNFLIY